MKTKTTLKDKIAALTAKHEQEQQNLVREAILHEILRAAVGTSYQPPSIHFHDLYGSKGSISYGERYGWNTAYSATPIGHADRKLFSDLLSAFPPVPIVEYRDSCLSFRAAIGDLAPENDPKLERVDLSDRHGITVKIDSSESKAEFKWFAYVDETLYTFSIHFHLDELDGLGTLSMKARHYGAHGPIASWEYVRFFPSEPNATVTKWASGSREYPNDFTLSWDTDSGSEIDFLAMVKK